MIKDLEIEFNKIDEKLSILLNNMEETEYVNFIKNSEVLKNIDFILGQTDNGTLPLETKNLIKEEDITKANEIIDEKIKELNLN